MGGYNLLDATMPDLGDQTGVSFFKSGSPSKRLLSTSTNSSSCDGDPLRELSALLGHSVMADTTTFNFENASDMSLLKDEAASFLADQTLFTTANMSRFSPSKKPKLSTMTEEGDSEGEELPINLGRILPKRLSRPVALQENVLATPTATHSMTGLLNRMQSEQDYTDLMYVNGAQSSEASSLFQQQHTRRISDRHG